MRRLRRILKLFFTPVTIMLVPHSRARSLSLKVPVVVIALSLFLICTGAASVLTASVRTVDYYHMRDRLAYVTSQFMELESTMHSLKRAENEFRKLFSLKSKEDVLEKADFGDAALFEESFDGDQGSLDMEALKDQIAETMKSVTDIRSYISEQRDIYLATPMGWPVSGRLSSRYGYRLHPKHGTRRFHSGVDISVPKGTPIKVTADGIVSFAGWTRGSGNAVVVEHGHGYSTAYAHNKRNLVAVGQRVKRGDTIAIVGSTGVSTGPHVHYEIWKNGRHVNPHPYLATRRS
jgi:murein DD-endopeptidase MepM/ murein hydrolase activator NlpD